ncbi:VIR-like CYIR protein [Plasmodium cynomolgi strain B]|uniref:VIR-like CYIR protein n=1 Tax=Plasmodium cynomolgi (strain B) TaxID=1120755 RepID=K6UVJ4_PLACD|nr:VIR-like CYIR protein [Plasmodium cynomolgi strain B]GAB67534.1 VIR-like CYIR protein [Plasmodium cynomolgi strain B]
MATWSRFTKKLKCTSDYFNSKNDVDQQITKISNKGQVHFCHSSENLKQYIIKRNNELNGCYSNKLLRNQLTDDSDIKNFINNCTVYSKCINNHQIRAVRTSERKKSTEDLCKKNNTCSTETASTKVTGKLEAVLETKASEIIAPGRKESSDQSQKHAVLADLKDEKIISEIEYGKISSADSAGNRREVYDSDDIQHSNTSGQGETSAQYSQILPHTTTAELDTLSGAPSLKNTIFGESQSKKNSEVLDSAEVVPKSGLNAHKGVASSSVLEQAVSDKAEYKQDSKVIYAFTEKFQYPWYC